MIQELDKTEFDRCKSLVNNQRQIEALAVIEGTNPGRIFVDDAAIPTSGMIWLGNNDGFFLIGNEDNEKFNNELNYFIDEVIIPEAAKVQLNWFEWIGIHDRWNKTIEKVFKARKLDSWMQKVYTLQPHDYLNIREPIIAMGYEAIKIDQSFLKSSLVQNRKFLQAKILESWSSIEDYLSNGIGYCMLDENEIASVCFSGFVAGNIHSVHIETLAAHQGRKLAQKAAHLFIQDCFEQNLIPHWECMEENKASVAVAENIGFKHIYNYKGYAFPG
ncbi:GNAT family N-acetyltransferase [Bacillus sp. SD088]|uniref:GNAT family N-acetyltransferase n=1 Tax=Bacillus sp. SD088 TaxID=2782012 RepID=UPI001A97534F|nr:GNAT family N-acetyltransferase [Bacillus sp. SD088]MBO0992460.1 GNAT family N-acetyltransferase [Bacillus sp. SD088]